MSSPDDTTVDAPSHTDRSPDLSWGNFTEQGPWVLSREAISWTRVADVLRQSARREIPRLVTPSRVPPVGRLIRVVFTFGVALAPWFWKKRGWIGARKGFASPEESRAYLSRRLRVAIEKLGATYIKLAQIISSGEGLFPAELVNEFIASREWKKGQATRAAGLIADFLVWESHKS